MIVTSDNGTVMANAYTYTVCVCLVASSIVVVHVEMSSRDTVVFLIFQDCCVLMCKELDL